MVSFWSWFRCRWRCRCAGECVRFTCGACVMGSKSTTVGRSDTSDGGSSTASHEARTRRRLGADPPQARCVVSSQRPVDQCRTPLETLRFSRSLCVRKSGAPSTPFHDSVTAIGRSPAPGGR